MLKLNQPFTNQKNCIISFFKSSDLGFESKFFFFFAVLVDILPLRSGCADPHILGSQYLADPTDPNPKH